MFQSTVVCYLCWFWLGLRTLSCWKTMVFLRRISSTAVKQCYRSLVSLSLLPPSYLPSNLPFTIPPSHFNTPLLTITCRPLLILYISPLHVPTSDTMNSTAFSPVKSDINGNIEVHCRQSSHSEHRRRLLSPFPPPPPPSSPHTCTHTEINEEV